MVTDNQCGGDIYPRLAGTEDDDDVGQRSILTWSRLLAARQDGGGRAGNNVIVSSGRRPDQYPTVTQLHPNSL